MALRCRVFALRIFVAQTLVATTMRDTHAHTPAHTSEYAHATQTQIKYALA